MTIAITGASGQLGQIVVAKLKEQHPAHDIVALVRNPQKAEALGVEARKADYDDAQSLESALKGVDTLLLISSSEVGKRAVQHSNVIAAAKKAGVKHIVYTSLLHADSSPLNLAAEHVETEEALKSSGIAFTILRNGWYTENYTGSLAGALAAGGLIGSAGNGKIASSARQDYAEAAVKVLVTQGHEGKTYELAGNVAWTLSDLAAELSKQSGKQIAYHDLPQDEYAQKLAGFGLPEGFAAAIASWDVGAAHGALYDDSHTLSQLIGRPTTSLATSVADALKAA